MLWSLRGSRCSGLFFYVGRRENATRFDSKPQTRAVIRHNDRFHKIHSSLSLSHFSLSLHWSVWNPNHMHLSSTNLVTSRQIEIEWQNVDVAHGYFLPECSYQVSMIYVLYKQVCGQDNFSFFSIFQQLLLLCSVSHDPSEIIWICWFVA